MSGDITPEACGVVLLFIAGYFVIGLMESAFWNSINGGQSASNPNVQKRDQHRKKNCAVENCNAVVFRMTDFCHRHQNETLVPSNKNESEETNSNSQNWWETEEPLDLQDTISTDTSQKSRSIPIVLLAGLFFLGWVGLVPVIGYLLYTAFTKRGSEF